MSEFSVFSHFCRTYDTCLATTYVPRHLVLFYALCGEAPHGSPRDMLEGMGPLGKMSCPKTTDTVIFVVSGQILTFHIVFHDREALILF